MIGIIGKIAGDVNIGNFIDRYSPERVAQRTLAQKRSRGIEIKEDVPLRRSKRKKGGSKKKKSKKKKSKKKKSKKKKSKKKKSKKKKSKKKKSKKKKSKKKKSKR